MANASSRPTQAIIRMYDVGFGDCFLVKLRYGNDDAKERRVLVDFGSTQWRKAKGASALGIAKDIAAQCQGNGKAKLHAIVATHRHADHVSGFATAKGGNGSGDIIAALEPDVVIQPWTEEPGLATKAAAPANSGHAFARRLANMEAVSQAVVGSLRHLRSKASNEDVDEIRFIGLDNIANRSAVENLARMASRARYKGKYVHAGMPLKLDALLPGLKIHVLGPPTIDQAPAVRKMTKRQADEYWHLHHEFWEMQAANASFDGGTWGKSFGGEHVTLESIPIYARWFVRQLRAAQTDMTRGLVRRLDRQMNNTSIIVVFEAGKKKLLFPGDAQWENWEYALSQGKYKKLLSDIDVYKVGHHGSLNATPKKSLWGQFSRRSTMAKKGRLTTLLSTLEGKHGHKKDKTEVPRRTLVTELRKDSHLTDTQTFGDTEFYRDIAIDLT
jgi:hypothetical protein